MPPPLLWVWLAFVFLLGAAVGSFINACAARLPYEKSILWPGSHCFRCFQPIRWYDNVPLLSYWLLGGRCRRCRAPFSVRYFLVELFTALAFAGLFYADVVSNLPHIPLLAERHEDIVKWGMVPWRAWVVFGWHATLFGFLLTASLCDLEHMEIPLSLTVTGTLVGLVGSAFLAWPFPATEAAERKSAAPPPRLAAQGTGGPERGRTAELPAPPPQFGLYPWPVWHPKELPGWLPPGSPQLGLATGLAGALAGMLVLRAVRFLFGLGRGLEAMGLGDADLMMMAGAFLGWQPIITAFLLSILPGLMFGLGQLALRGTQEMPFGPSLAVGVMLTVLVWPWVAGTEGRSGFAGLFFSAEALIGLTVFGLVALFLAALLLRFLRGPAAAAEPEETAKREA